MQFDVAEVNTIFDSAIETRVISRFAGEEWRLEVSAHTAKYTRHQPLSGLACPLPIKKVNPEYALRQKGKVAELAREWETPTMIDILTENEILAMMEEFRENPQNFRFVA